MYKKISLWLLALWIIFSIPYAKADVQDVSFNFCDDTWSKYFMEWKRNFLITPGEESEICIVFATNSETSRQIVYGFTEWLTSPGGIPICESDKSANNNFSKLFIASGERSFIITKNQPKTIREKIRVPIGMSGIQYGCLAYSLGVPEGWTIGGMFNLVINKVFPISLFVGVGGDIKNDVVLLKNGWGAYTTNNQVKASMDQNNNLKIDFLLKNQGNISQNVIITGRIYNILGFEKPFSITLNNLSPGDQKEGGADIGIIPFYKGPFSVSYTVQFIPKFEFDMSTLSDDVKKWGMITWSAQIYLFSWISLIIILAILAIIIKFFRPRKKIIVTAQQ